MTDVKPLLISLPTRKMYSRSSLLYVRKVTVGKPWCCSTLDHYVGDHLSTAVLGPSYMQCERGKASSSQLQHLHIWMQMRGDTIKSINKELSSENSGLWRNDPIRNRTQTQSSQSTTNLLVTNYCDSKPT